MNSLKIKVGDYFPRITLPTISGTEIEVSEAYQGASWHVVIFYRGFHCSRCTEFLNQLEHHKKILLEHSISIIAVSADNGEQLQRHLKELNVSFPIVYGLSIAQMHELNLYISLPQDFNQTDHPFCEPGTFVINDLGQIVVIDIASSEVSRPNLEVLVSGIIELKEDNHPIQLNGGF